MAGGIVEKMLPSSGAQPGQEFRTIGPHLSSQVQAHLILEAPKNLLKHVFELSGGVGPARHSVAEEEEVLNNPTRIQTDHQTHASKCRLLFFVVSNVPGIK